MEPAIDAVAQGVAEAVGQAMISHDAAMRGLGMELLEIGPGRARLRMAVRPDMLNSLGICHGGFIFTLADSAFAFACNSYNKATVAQRADISFLAMVPADAVLVAEAREMASTGRSGVYDVEVRDQHGRLLGLFRGHSRQVKGAVTPPPGSPALASGETAI